MLHFVLVCAWKKDLESCCRHTRNFRILLTISIFRLLVFMFYFCLLSKTIPNLIILLSREILMRDTSSSFIESCSALRIRNIPETAPLPALHHHSHFRYHRYIPLSFFSSNTFIFLNSSHLKSIFNSICTFLIGELLYSDILSYWIFSPLTS